MTPNRLTQCLLEPFINMLGVHKRDRQTFGQHVEKLFYGLWPTQRGAQNKYMHGQLASVIRKYCWKQNLSVLFLRPWHLADFSRRRRSVRQVP